MLVVVVLLSLWVNQAKRDANTLASLDDEMRQTLQLLQAAIEQFQADGNAQGTRVIVANAGAVAGLDGVLVADAQGQVLAATDFRWVGRPWDELGLGIVPARVADVTRRQVAEVVIDESAQKLRGYVSVCGSPSGASLRQPDCGLLYRQIDLRWHRDDNVSQLWDESLGLLLLFVLPALLLFLYLHLKIDWPVRRLIAGLASYQGGEHRVAAPADGSEFATLGRQINQLLQRVHRNEARLRLADLVFHGTSEAIVVTGPDKRILEVNDAYLETTGYGREEVLGKTPALVSSGHHPPEFYQAMWAAIGRDGHWSGEVWDRRKGGEVYPQWLTINAISDERGVVSHYVGIFQDVTRQKQAEQQLHDLAYRDPLTDLPNRLLFRDRLEHQITLCQREKSQMAVMFLDLDRFKNVNDTLGHDIGDQLLIETAERLSSRVRRSDTVSRLGGDEFTLILPGIMTPGHVSSLARDIIAELQRPFELAGNEVFVGASIGISLFPQDGEDFVTLTRHADAAMYQAKSAGRGQYRFFTASLNERLQRRANLETGLRTALEKDEFCLVYQPKVDVVSRQVKGFEALLRWRSPQLGPVSPAEFIPLAEDTGMIIDIGAWVLETACREARSWQEAGHAGLHVAVNLSARQFQYKSLVAEVEGALRRERLPAAALEIELTETLLMSDVETSLKVMEALRELGLSIAVDDFGTGYSSLAYLKRLPIQTLKIDRSFVNEMTEQSDDASIVQAILSLARRLQLGVVAEGVETLRQHELLLAGGCDVAQGFYYARPIPAAEVLGYLQRAAAGKAVG